MAAKKTYNKLEKRGEKTVQAGTVQAKKVASAAKKPALEKVAVPRKSASTAKKAESAGSSSLISVGSALPKAKLLDQDGKSIELSQFKGSWLVVYFYPKDDTPGCTREACNFQEQLATFKRQSAVVVGVSPDNALRHRKFADKYGLTFPLLVDEDKSFATACGVIGEKVLYGKRSLGVIRSTLIVDPSGVIRQTFHKVKVDGHTEVVLQALQSLRKS